MKPSLGEFIRKRRVELGLTQRQVALALNFKSIAYLSDIEGGNRNPGPEVLPALAKILDVSLDTLEDHDARLPVQAARELLEERPEMVAAFRRVVEKARSMSPEELLKRIDTASSASSAPPPDRDDTRPPGSA